MVTLSLPFFYTGTPAYSGHVNDILKRAEHEAAVYKKAGVVCIILAYFCLHFVCVRACVELMARIQEITIEFTLRSSEKEKEEYSKTNKNCSQSL